MRGSRRSRWSRAKLRTLRRGSSSTPLPAPSSSRTRRAGILGNAFLFEPVELGPAKGFETGIEAFRVMGEALGASRFEKRHGAAIPAIVGRNQEIDLLLARWKQAKGGEGQGVLLVGEPGIGKSRILRALIDELRGEPHQRIDAQCSPYYLDRPLWPIVEHLRTAFDIRPSQPVTEQLGRLERSLQRPWRCAGGGCSSQCRATRYPLRAVVCRLGAVPAAEAKSDIAGSQPSISFAR